ncbi:NAD-dependent malic enzyme [Pontiella sulfatireligans]|uniref:NAD-dependent malic enzyme n=1 Tax=Pontiella sulfatireligans TaxID=2750658 RepID=A0A6C2UT73_9BACT|nr:NAD-dependent malic enzyme [Pontiella sulfatireligans]VGO22096.1 NAD-dependent malic enzyme [Pontiella sulfatireligans]
MRINPSPSYSILVRLQIPREPGIIGRISAAIGEAGGIIDTIDLVSRTEQASVRDILIEASSCAHQREIIQALEKVDNVYLLSAEDLTFKYHIGGKLETGCKLSFAKPEVLAIAYTPGVARVCTAIHKNKALANNLTIKRNTVAVVSDGTAVLGLGDIGPEAAMPVMEGKCQLFKEFGGIDAFPICLDTQDPEEIIRTVKLLAPTFGGINLEDISSPRCFEIEERLKAEMDIPVFHDDQHGTAVVLLAALFNALKIVDKKIEDLKIVICGIGAAGTACANIMLEAGAKNIVGYDLGGAVYKGRSGDHEHLQAFAEKTNPEMEQGPLSEGIKGADLFIGLSAPGVLKQDDVKNMAADPIIFAMANPVPEIMPETAQPYARIMATGRSDYPNQINNVLCFPGIFKGALRCNASAINEEMKIVAAHAIADLIPADELNEQNIIPSVFNENVVEAVAQEVERVARESGLARERADDASLYKMEI